MKKLYISFFVLIAFMALLSMAATSVASEDGGAPLQICVNFHLADWGPNSYGVQEFYEYFNKNKPQYNILKASSMQEAQDVGCDIYLTGIEGGKPITGNVFSVYSKKILMKAVGRCGFLDPRGCYVNLGDNLFDSFEPGTSKYRKVIAEREAYQRPQQPQAYAPPAPAVTKEELKNIVEAAVEKSQKKTEKPAPAVSSDIDNPAFDATDRIMGDNDIAVIIGIEGYQNLPKSDYSYDDARLVKEYAKALGFKERNIELLTDERATKTNIEKSLEAWLKNKAKPQSRVFVYYSGHGAPDPSTGDAYLVPYDGDPNYLSITGYPLKRLYGNMGKLRAKEVTVVLDACFSGAGGRSVLAKGARPLVMMTESLTLSSNMAVLSATQGSQISTSSPERGHGIFTYYFLKALKDGHKDLGEIYGYMKPLVEDDAKALNVQQSPTLNPAPEKLAGRFLLRK